MGAARRLARTVVTAIGIALLSILAFVFSVAVHAESDVGLAAAEHLIEWSGSKSSRGTVRVGRVRALPPGLFSLLDYRIIAPDGEVVIAADEIAGMPEWRGLLDGQMRFRPSWFIRANIRLTRGPGGQVNLIHASEVPEGVSTFPLVFEDIRLVDNTIFVDLPGKPAVTMRHVHGLADLHVGHLWQWRLDNNRGEIDLPIIEPGFRNMNGRLRSDHAHPLVVRMVVNAAIIETSLALDYYVPALAGREGEPHLDLDLGEDVEGHGVDETEEQEEARDDLAEAREEREEVEQALRVARREGDDEGVREARRALAERVSEEREALRTAREQGVARRRTRTRSERPRDEPESASAAEEENLRALARERPDRESVARREREGRAEMRELEREGR